MVAKRRSQQTSFKWTVLYCVILLQLGYASHTYQSMASGTPHTFSPHLTHTAITPTAVSSYELITGNLKLDHY